jgi:hypothetical protein
MKFSTLLLMFILSFTAAADLSIDISDVAARAQKSTTCDSSQLKERAVGGLEKAALVQSYCAEISGRDCESVIAKSLRGDFVDVPFDCGTMTSDLSQKKSCINILDTRVDALVDQRKSIETSTPVQNPTPELFNATAQGIADAHPGRKTDVVTFKSEIDNYIRATQGAKFVGHRSSFVLGENIRQCLRADQLLNIRLKRALERINSKQGSAGAADGVSR